MEIKDWIYSIGLVLTFTVSVVSLFINVKNRKNAIREHLYKEQMTFFLELSKEFGVLSKYFENILFEKKLTDEADSDLNKQIDFSKNNELSPSQLLNWLDFWSAGNHDDRTLAIIY